MLAGTRGDATKAENYPEYVQWVRKVLQTAHTFARRHLQKSLMRNQRNFNAYAKNRPTFITYPIKTVANSQNHGQDLVKYPNRLPEYTIALSS